MSNVLITYKSKPHTDSERGFSSPHVRKEFNLAPIVLAEINDAQASILRTHPNVIAVELDGFVSIPEDEQTVQESMIAADRAPWGITKVRAAEVHARGVHGLGMKVAVIDTGISFTHPDLASIYKGGINIVTPGTPPMDDHSHGTHCAGTVAAVLDGQGVFGVAPSIELYAVKVLNAQGSGSWSSVIAAYEWCIQNGMHVTSNSYGGSAGSVALETALNAAVDAGILMIFAAGNNGVSVLYPAKYAKAIAVSATDENDVIASFSSRGPEVMLAAPGVNVESTVLDGLYGFKSGTSMACPHVAGACALALSKGFTASEVRTRLTTTSVDKGEPGRDPLYGWGRLDTYELVFKEGLAVPRYLSPITVDGAASVDPDGSIVSYFYSLNTGQTFSGSKHTITLVPGSYAIELTVTDNSGAIGKATKAFMIDAPAPPPNQVPTASFTITGA